MLLGGRPLSALIFFAAQVFLILIIRIFIAKGGVMIEFVRTIYKWCTFTAERSWRSHAIISTVFIAVVVAVAYGYQQDGVAWAWYAAIAAAIFFRIKEIFDQVRHKRLGDWRKRQWEDKVTPEVDESGDLLGAYTCLWLTTALMLARKLGGWMQAVL